MKYNYKYNYNYCHWTPFRHYRLSLSLSLSLYLLILQLDEFKKRRYYKICLKSAKKVSLYCIIFIFFCISIFIFIFIQGRAVKAGVTCDEIDRVRSTLLYIVCHVLVCLSQWYTCNIFSTNFTQIFIARVHIELIHFLSIIHVNFIPNLFHHWSFACFYLLFIIW